MTWRVGRKLGRTLYRDDVCVGMVDTPELAAEIVEAMNAVDAPAVLRRGEQGPPGGESENEPLESAPVVDGSPRCSRCFGVGVIGQPVFPEKCPKCGGTGLG